MQRLTQILSRPFIWMICVLLVAYWQVAFCRYTMQWDMTSQVFIWHRFISECFHAHIIPLWAPYSRLGYPIFADPQSGVFYPITWLFTLFGHYTLRSNDLEYMLHVILAAFGMRYLLTSLSISRPSAALFGLVYAMSGPMVGHASHLMLIGSLCWLPFVLGSYIRFLRSDGLLYLLLTALFIFLQLCGGYAGITITMVYVLIVILIYYLGTNVGFNKKAVAQFTIKHLLLALVTALMSAGYLYAVSLGKPYIDRGTDLTLAYAASVPFSPVSLITMLYPSVGGEAQIRFHTDLTMEDFYIGIIPLVLMAVTIFLQRKRSTYVILLGSLFFLLASMGEYTPIRGWMYDYMPLMKLFRHAGILRFFTCIGFIVLAARGFDLLINEEKTEYRPAFKCILGIALLLASLGAMYMVHRLSFHLHYLLPVILILVLWLVFFIGSLSAATRRHLIGILIIADMILSVQVFMGKTIISEQKLGLIQSHIDEYPSGFPIPDNVSIISYSQWNDSSIAPPIWQNGGFIKKQISYEGYNGFNLKNYNDLINLPDFYERFGGKKFIESSAGGNINIKAFGPEHWGFDVDAPTEHKVILGQIYFPGWEASVDSKEVSVTERADHFISCDVPAGSHHVDMTFAPKGAKFAFVYTVVVTLLLLSAIGIAMRRPS